MTFIKNEKKIRASLLQLNVEQLSYSHDKLIKYIEKLLTLWIEELNQKSIPLNQAIISDKAKSIFNEQKEECMSRLNIFIL